MGFTQRPLRGCCRKKCPWGLGVCGGWVLGGPGCVFVGVSWVSGPWEGLAVCVMESLVWGAGPWVLEWGPGYVCVGCLGVRVGPGCVYVGVSWVLGLGPECVWWGGWVPGWGLGMYMWGCPECQGRGGAWGELGVRMGPGCVYVGVSWVCGAGPGGGVGGLKHSHGHDLIHFQIPKT